ncbi:unnamed protein product [Blepharisma stoltei]|uniref:Uncharacterized protein n=1 Tax=Blepharisma stoltei TaxID=1481888 RepID=A0AAU9I8V4_9CILI|nr:unnamed protein product [Blepharisma stoltei]
MGSCFSKSKKSKSKDIIKTKIPTKFEEFYYLDRHSAIILHHKADGMIEILEFKNRVKFNINSAVGYMTKTRLIVAGGSNGGKYSKNVYDVDFATADFVALKELPIPSRSGTLIKYENRIYFVGGISKSNRREKPAPLMYLNLADSTWKFLICEQLNQDYRNYADLNPEFPIQNLWFPGAFLWNDRIYIVGGYKINNQRRPESNSDVYSLNLKNNSLRKEKFIFPIEGAHPLCSVNGNEVTIISRYDPLDGKKSSKWCIVKMIEDSPMIKTSLNPINIELTEFYPAIKSLNATIFISNPHFILKRNNSYRWQTFELQRVILVKNLRSMENQASNHGTIGRAEKFSELDESQNSQWMSPEWHHINSKYFPSLTLIEIDCKEVVKAKIRQKKGEKSMKRLNDLMKAIKSGRRGRNREDSESENGSQNSVEEESDSEGKSEDSRQSSYNESGSEEEIDLSEISINY